jgi:hypothetical protein
MFVICLKKQKQNLQHKQHNTTPATIHSHKQAKKHFKKKHKNIQLIQPPHPTPTTTCTRGFAIAAK